MTEEWRPVVGNHRYEVSSLGRVRRAPRVLKPRLKRGYERVTLGGGKRRIRTQNNVHRLVAAAFLGPAPSGLQVNHKNGIKTDNRAENLEYVTAKENIRHSFSEGINKGRRGSLNGCAKLTEENVKEIMSAPQYRGVQSDLARRFGVGTTAIWAIINRKTWRHVQP